MYFKRNNQYWKIKKNGSILLINTQEENHHYDGDAHLFLNKKQFNTEHATKISKSDFNKARDVHLKRLTDF